MSQSHVGEYFEFLHYDAEIIVYLHKISELLPRSKAIVFFFIMPGIGPQIAIHSHTVFRYMARSSITSETIQTEKYLMPKD